MMSTLTFQLTAFGETMESTFDIFTPMISAALIRWRFHSRSSNDGSHLHVVSPIRA